MAARALFGDRDAPVPKTARPVVEGALMRSRDLRSSSGSSTMTRQRESSAALTLKGGILGGRADQDDVAALDVGQEGVLLGAVEAVDLVDEQEACAALGAAQPCGVGHDVLDVLDPRGQRR